MDYRLKLFEMMANNFDITFIFTKQGIGQESIKENHLCIPEKWKHKILKTNFIFFGKDIGMFFRLAKEIFIGNYDAVIISTNWYICWPIAKITRKKVIYWTEFWYWENHSLIRKLLNSCTFYIARNSDSIITTGSKAYFSFLKLGVSKEKMFTHPQCSAYYDVGNAVNLKANLGLTDKKVILYLGRIVSFKGLNYLIEALKIVNDTVNDAYLIVVGTGPFEAHCKKLANDLCISNIIFTGYLDDASMKLNYYKTCDLFILPSIMSEGKYEPWGLVVNEAMGFSKPVITTDAVGSEYDMVQDDYNGYVVPNKDAKALANAILFIIQDEYKMKQMGFNSRKRYEEINVHEKLFSKFKEAIDYVFS